MNTCHCIFNLLWRCAQYSQSQSTVLSPRLLNLIHTSCNNSFIFSVTRTWLFFWRHSFNYNGYRSVHRTSLYSRFIFIVWFNWHAFANWRFFIFYVTYVQTILHIKTTHFNDISRSLDEQSRCNIVCFAHKYPITRKISHFLYIRYKMWEILDTLHNPFIQSCLQLWKIKKLYVIIKT